VFQVAPDEDHNFRVGVGVVDGLEMILKNDSFQERFGMCLGLVRK